MTDNEGLENNMRIRIERNTKHKDTWTPWFAWYPVLCDGRLVWLENVKWMRIGGRGPYSGIYYKEVTT